MSAAPCSIFGLPIPEGARPSVLSYLVRVIPDPEQKERLDRVYKALEGEINRRVPE